jgi:hypothetical protein
VLGFKLSFSCILFDALLLHPMQKRHIIIDKNSVFFMFKFFN